jgi:hypothetical protein
MLSGIRREKEAPDGLDIEDYSMDLGISDLGREKEAKVVKERIGRRRWGKRKTVRQNGTAE